VRVRSTQSRVVSTRCALGRHAACEGQGRRARSKPGPAARTLLVALLPRGPHHAALASAGAIVDDVVAAARGPRRRARVLTRLAGAHLDGLRACDACGAALRRHAAQEHQNRRAQRRACPGPLQRPRACARGTPAAAPLAEGAQGADARREGARLVRLTWLLCCAGCCAAGVRARSCATSDPRRDRQRAAVVHTPLGGACVRR
jgi:hypothetical protein